MSKVDRQVWKDLDPDYIIIMDVVFSLKNWKATWIISDPIYELKIEMGLKSRVSLEAPTTRPKWIELEDSTGK